MATITASDPLIRVGDRFTLFGYPVPPNVIAIDVWYDPQNAFDVIRWRVEDSAEIHSMDLQVVTDETIFAVLAAMRISC